MFPFESRWLSQHKVMFYTCAVAYSCNQFSRGYQSISVHCSYSYVPLKCDLKTMYLPHIQFVYRIAVANCKVQSSFMFNCLTHRQVIIATWNI